MIINDRIMMETEDAAISYKKGCLYCRKSIEDKPTKICELPIFGLKKYASKFSLTERLLRLEPRFALPYIESKIYISYNGSMYIVDYKASTIEEVHKYRGGMHNPLNVCIVSNIYGFDNGVYYGEYWGNKSHDEVSIYYGNGRNWNKRYTFPRGEILHIHAIVPDEKNKQIFILTGDSDNESAIWCAKDNFERVERVCGGSQQYRSCIVYRNGNVLIYATDTPLESNYIYKYYLDKEKVEVFSEISGPCIYSAKVEYHGKTYCLFATTVEPDSRLVGGWRYRLSLKPGPGVKDNYSHLYITDFDKVVEVGKYKKDLLPLQLFQFGNLRFPFQDSSYQGKVLICPQSIKHLHGKTIVLEMADLVAKLEGR